MACSLVKRDPPVAATLQRKSSGGIIFVIITKIITKETVPRNYFVIISARMVFGAPYLTPRLPWKGFSESVFCVLSGLIRANRFSLRSKPLFLRIDLPEISHRVLQGAAQRGAQFYLILTVLRALFSCSETSLFSLKTCTPLKATPWSTPWIRKIPAPIKIKSALPPPPPQPQNTPPPKTRNFTDTGFPAERRHFFQVSIKLAQPFPAPELRTRTLRTRGFFWENG